jgi:hypothetical protein
VENFDQHVRDVASEVVPGVRELYRGFAMTARCSGVLTGNMKGSPTAKLRHAGLD